MKRINGQFSPCMARTVHVVLCVERFLENDFYVNREREREREKEREREREREKERERERERDQLRISFNE